MRVNNKKIMEKFTKSKLVAQIAITSFVAALAIVGVAYATTIGTNILTTGTLTVTGLTAIGNNITVPAAYGLDTAAAGVLNIGTTTATTINIGGTQATTKVLGLFQVPAAYGLDTVGAGQLNIGTTTATAIRIGDTGVTTTNAGALTVTELLTANGGITLENATTITNPSAGVISLGGAVNVAGFATTTAAGIMMPTQQYAANAGCAAGTVGGLIFNAAKQILCVCTGTTWKAATSTTAVDCF